MTYNMKIQVFLGRYAVLTDTSLLPVSKKGLLLLIDRKIRALRSFERL